MTTFFFNRVSSSADSEWVFRVFLDQPSFFSSSMIVLNIQKKKSVAGYRYHQVKAQENTLVTGGVYILWRGRVSAPRDGAASTENAQSSLETPHFEHCFISVNDRCPHISGFSSGLIAVPLAPSRYFCARYFCDIYFPIFL